MSESDREQLVNLTDELLMTDNLETIQEISWTMKEILRRSSANFGTHQIECAINAQVQFMEAVDWRDKYGSTVNVYSER